MSLDYIDLTDLSKSDKLDLLEKLTAYNEKLHYNKLECLFPATGPYRRALYYKAFEFFNAGVKYRERAMIGGNRSGKSFNGSYETALHLTGKYPDWWQGKRFKEPISAICLGVSHDSVRNVAQHYLCGNAYDLGSGFIPKEDLYDYKSKPGIPNAFSQIVVKHYTDGVFDGYSICDFMSYDQGADVIQGTTRHWVWEDEENPHPEVHSELVMRTATSGGSSILTFTPRHNLTQIVLGFLPNGQFPHNNIVHVKTDYGMVDRFVLNIPWEDVPESQLSKETRAEMIAGMQSWEIEARVHGRPAIGSGKVYITSESDFVINPILILPTWKKFYGLDIPVFSGRTACVWFAYDEYTDQLYLYDEYVCSAQHISVACTAIRKRGAWIPGVIDVSAGKRAPDGETYLAKYQDEGLNVKLAHAAPGSVGSSIVDVQTRLSNGQFKVFSTCVNWLEEYRMYRYATSKHGVVEIAKNQKDDLMDATRYAVVYGLRRAEANPELFDSDEARYRKEMKTMSRDDITGY